MPWSPECRPPADPVRPVAVRWPGPAWRRVAHGLYVPAAVDGHVVEQRIVEASCRLGVAGAVTGWASLRMHGAAYFDGDGTAVPMVSPDRQLSPKAGSEVSRAPLDATEVVTICGVACTTIERALFDHVRGCSWWEGVRSIDMAIAAGLTSRRRMLLYVGGRRGWAGRSRALDAVCDARDHVASPRETDTRLVWTRVAGLPRPECNRPVFSWDGTLLGIPDLLDVEAGLVVEYDGIDHRSARRRQRDVAREEAFRRHGLSVLIVVSPDLDDHVALAERMRRARDEALRGDVPAGEWTVAPPPGWRDPRPSLDERLLVQDLLRARRQSCE